MMFAVVYIYNTRFVNKTFPQLEGKKKILGPLQLEFLRNFC